MRIVFTICFLFFLLAGQAQSKYRISAEVFNSNSEPLDFGEVFLLIQDSLVNQSFIEKGKFLFLDLKANSYTLMIHSLGYKSYEKQLELVEDIELSIALEEEFASLDEITIKGQRKSIEYENGNMRISMANSIFSNQASTIDMFAMIPGLMVSPTGESINLIGRGSPLLYIGNRNITLDELKSIPLTDISEIQIVNNPSAKYEANGRSVILISLKRNRANGINVELVENAVKRRGFNNYFGSSINTKLNKWEFRTNINFNALQPWEGFESKILKIEDLYLVTNNTTSFGQRPQWTGGLGVFYEINEDDYLSFNSSFRAFRDFSQIENVDYNYFGYGQSTGLTFSDDLGRRSFYTANVNYNKGLKKLGTNIFTGLQVSRYNRALVNDIFYGSNENNLNLIQKRDQDYLVNVLAGKIDVEKKLFNQLNWESGTNIYTANAKALIFIDGLDNGILINSDYDYSERNIAFYTQLDGTFNKLNYTIGLRSEATQFYGKFVAIEKPVVDREQHNFFPRVNLSYTIDTVQSINLNFSSSIFRPNYLNASSITTFISPFVEYSRNPNLVPSIAQFLSLNYQYKQQSFNITGYQRNNVVQQSVTYDEARDLLISSPENFDYEQGINIRLNNNYSYKWYSLNHVSMFSINQLVDERATELLNVRPFFYISSNHRITLPKQVVFSVNFWMLSKRNSGIVERNAMYVLGSSLSKRYKKWNFSLNANDIFRQMNYGEMFSVNGISSENTFYADGQSIALSLRYSFGKQFKASFKNENVDENLRRMN